jgi:hypothetical protein
MGMRYGGSGMRGDRNFLYGRHGKYSEGEKTMEEEAEDVRLTIFISTQ